MPSTQEKYCTSCYYGYSWESKKMITNGCVFPCRARCAAPFTIVTSYQPGQPQKTEVAVTRFPPQWRGDSGNVLKVEHQWETVHQERGTCAWILCSNSCSFSHRQLRDAKVRGVSSSKALQLCAGAVALGMVYIPIPWHDGLWNERQGKWPNANTGLQKRML